MAPVIVLTLRSDWDEQAVQAVERAGVLAEAVQAVERAGVLAEVGEVGEVVRDEQEVGEVVPAWQYMTSALKEVLQKHHEARTSARYKPAVRADIGKYGYDLKRKEQKADYRAATAAHFYDFGTFKQGRAWQQMSRRLRQPTRAKIMF